jgi:putative transposase
MLTPFDVHHGLAELRQELRSEVLMQAFTAHPRRFKGRIPQPPPLPTEAWINKPRQVIDASQI